MSCPLLYAFVWSYCVDRIAYIASSIRCTCGPMARRKLDREGMYREPRPDALYTVRVRHAPVASLSGQRRGQGAVSISGLSLVMGWAPHDQMGRRRT